MQKKKELICEKIEEKLDTALSTSTVLSCEQRLEAGQLADSFEELYTVFKREIFSDVFEIDLLPARS